MKNLIALALILLSMASCTTTVTTLADQYPLMYEEKPLTIAIMPPINKTTHVEAKEYFYTTLYQPLCEKGYYVYSPYLTMEMFQQESAYNAEMFIDGSLTPFRDVLGADAVMFTIIKDWRRNNIGGNLSVNIEYILRSTKTGKTLYAKEGDIKVDTSVSSGGSSALSALTDLLATAVTTAATDKVVAGRKCNAYVLKDMPVGKYSTLYGKDTKHPASKKLIRGTVN